MFDKILSYIIPNNSRLSESDDNIAPENNKYNEQSIPRDEDDDHEDSETGSCRGYGLTKEEVLDALKKYVRAAYNDDWKSAFKGYAEEDDPDHLSFEGLCFMLRDAKCGNTLIRPVIATAILVQLDKDEDRKLTFEEFLKIRDGEFVG